MSTCRRVSVKGGSSKGSRVLISSMTRLVRCRTNQRALGTSMRSSTAHAASAARIRKSQRGRRASCVMRTLRGGGRAARRRHGAPPGKVTRRRGMGNGAAPAPGPRLAGMERVRGPPGRPQRPAPQVQSMPPIPRRRRAPAAALRPLALALLLAGAACTRAPAPPAGSAADGPAPRAAAGTPADSFPAPSRPVADIVTDTWSSEDARDGAGEAERVMQLLGVGPGMRVADVGAGSGYYVARLSPRVGPTGRVYAQDIVADYLAKLGDRVRREGLGNVTLVLGDPHDPRLPRDSVDLALLVHMYHEVEQPYGLLYNLRPALRRG